MQKYLLPIIVGLGLTVSGLYLPVAKPAAAAQSDQSSAVWDSGGRLQLPTGYRRWIFLGAPLTPDGLNGGKAGFPEYHHVYVEARNLDVYMKTGSFPEGTVIVKELTRALNPAFSDGSRTEPSGRGYFNGAYNGMDVTVKDSKRFPETNGWGFFNFGHHPEPYAAWAEAASATDCGGCHKTYVAKTDMTWVQFYPMLRDKQ